MQGTNESEAIYSENLSLPLPVSSCGYFFYCRYYLLSYYTDATVGGGEAKLQGLQSMIPLVKWLPFKNSSSENVSRGISFL